MNKKKVATTLSGARRKRRADMGTLGASLFGSAVGLFVAVLLSMVCALICLRSDSPDKLTSPLAFACSVMAYLTAGYCSARKRGGAAVPCGALSGALLTVIFFICSLFPELMSSGSMGFFVAVLLRASMIIVSLLGAIASVLRKR